MSPNAYTRFEHPADGTAIRVAINEGSFMFGADRLSIFLGQRIGNDGTRVVHFNPDGTMHWTDVPPLEASQASMEMPRDFAYALMCALVQHFDGAGDTRQLRADLLHERGRVDIMVNHIIAMGKQAMDKIPNGEDL